MRETDQVGTRGVVRITILAAAGLLLGLGLAGPSGADVAVKGYEGIRETTAGVRAAELRSGSPSRAWHSTARRHRRYVRQIERVLRTARSPSLLRRSALQPQPDASGFAGSRQGPSRRWQLGSTSMTRQLARQLARRLTLPPSSDPDRGDVENASSFAPCDPTLNPAALAECLSRRVHCQTCQMMSRREGALLDCDQLDNGIRDESCHTPIDTASTTTTSTTTTTLPLLASLDLTAFRPQAEYYGHPFQRRAVPEPEEFRPGIGIRRNGDDDNGNGVADRQEASVSGENDLVEITVNADGFRPGTTFHLMRSSAALRVWDTAQKSVPMITGGNSTTVLPGGSGNRTLWVEYPDGFGAADLRLEARLSDGRRIASDTLRFRPFNTIIIALDGEDQVPTDPISVFNDGTAEIAIQLYEMGFDIRMYDEDNVRADGSGIVYDEVVSAIRDRGVTNLAVYGFSHGGGSTYDLLDRLNRNRAGIGEYTLVFSGYMDAVENDSDIDLDSEVRLPPTTGYHVNYYQRNPLSVLIFGNSVPGADVDVNTTATSWGAGLVHPTFSLSPEVQTGIMVPLLERVVR